jgi:hypothetical protein
MHESKQNQTHPKSQVKSQTREGLEAQESLLDHQDPLVQQFSGLGNISNAGVHAQMLSRIPANQIAANPQLLLQMQQQFGNSHVSQVVQMARESSQQTSQQPLIQAKLTIGAPGDKYEQEADRVAAEVVQQIHAPEIRQKEKEETLQPKLMVQSKADGRMTASPELASSIQAARGSGQPLADNIREPMEQAFEADFSGVRVHADAQSDALNRSIQAKAFTTGQNVFFRQGEYQPQTREGQELIAHELTHVIQQNGKVAQQTIHQTDTLSAQESYPQAVGRMIYKVTPTEHQKTPVLQRTLANDIATITALRNALQLANPGTTLENILTEVINSSALVNAGAVTNVPASGSAVPRYNAAGARLDYTLNYQYGNIGNLVHELTHISVNEAYDQDFVNYLNPGAAAGVPARNINAHGYATNTAARETAWKAGGAAEETWLDNNLQLLSAWADSSGLTAPRIQQVKNQLLYGRINVHKEYDTVVNQILVWLHYWGFAPGDPFYDQVAAVAQEAYVRRTGGNAINTAAASPVALPPPPPPAPVHGNKKCYITTACVTAKGLPDDCDELTTLRGFRDKYMMNLEAGEALIQQYYQTAPLIVAAIESQPNSREILEGLYTEIMKCVNLIKSGQNEKALREYIDMVQELKATYIG